MAAADDFAGLMTTRFFLGALEAGVSPCFVLLTTMFYKRLVSDGTGVALLRGGNDNDNSWANGEMPIQVRTAAPHGAMVFDERHGANHRRARRLRHRLHRQRAAGLEGSSSSSLPSPPPSPHPTTN